MNSSGDPQVFRSKVADIRHDIRTFTGQIIGYAEMLEEDFQDGGRSEILRELARVRQAGETMVDLMEEYLGPFRTGAEFCREEQVERALEGSIEDIAQSCRALRPLLVDTDWSSDLGKINKALDTLAILWAGFPRYLGDSTRPNRCDQPRGKKGQG